MMVHEPELKEGECYYNKDDASVDPDIALSYIGDKVQNILGNFQKDFEGGFSTENLGAKYGGYGSFLPMYHQAPSNLVQPKSLPTVQNMHMQHRYHHHVLPEVPAPDSLVVPGARTENNGSVRLLTTQPKHLRTSIDDSSTKAKTCLSSSDKVAEAFPKKVELPSAISDNGPIKRSLKVRIKLGPRRVAKCNAEIDKLGLTTASSTGKSYEGISEFQRESHGSPGEFPSRILQMMASAPVAGHLLSPLSEDLLNLTKGKYFSKEDVHEADPRISDKSSRTLKIKSKTRSRSVMKSKKFEESDNEHVVDLNDFQRENLQDNAICIVRNCVASSETIIIPDRDSKVKNMKRGQNAAKERAERGDYVKTATLEHSSQQSFDKYEQPKSRCGSAYNIGKDCHAERISNKDVSAYHSQVMSSRGNRDSAFEAYSDISKEQWFKKAVENPKVGLKVLPGEHIDSGLCQATDSLPTEGCKKSTENPSSEQLARKSANASKKVCSVMPENKNRLKNDLQTFENEVDLASLAPNHTEKNRFLEKRSLDKPNKINLEVAKQKISYAGEPEETSTDGKNLGKVAYGAPTLEAPPVAVLSNERIHTSLDQTTAAPFLIQEDWVACDLCGKWRLLPYGGTKSEQLPEKWVCGMMDWLPGMNRCDISEVETTNAVEALYLMAIDDVQPNALANGERIVSGVFSSGAHHSDQNDVRVKKLKRKEKLNSVSNDPIHFNGKKQVQQKALEKGHWEKMNQSLNRVNIMNYSDSQNQNGLSTAGVVMEKQKGNHLVRDEETQRKRIKKFSSQHVDVKEEKIKSRSALVSDNFHISAGIEPSLKPGLPHRTAPKSGMKSILPKAAISGGKGSIKIHMEKQKHQMWDVPSKRPLGAGTVNERETTLKNVKVKDCGCSKPQDETLHNNGIGLLEKASIRRDSTGSDCIRDEKYRASWIREEESRKSQGEDKVRALGAGVGARLLQSKEYPSNKAENEQRIMKPRSQMRITKEYIKNVVPLAATSSSSKVSDSRKKRSYTDMICSPAESVSSSIAKLSYPNKIPPISRETFGNVKHLFAGLSATGSGKKYRDMDENTSHPSSNHIILLKNKLQYERKGDGREPCRGKMLVDLHKGDKQSEVYPRRHASGSSRSSNKSYLKLRPLYTSVADTKSVKGQTSAFPFHGSDNYRNAEAVRPLALESSLVTENVSGGRSYNALTEAQDVLKEAEELKSHADLIKTSGFISERNYEYLKAALKYLKGASLLEACNGGSCKSMVVNPIQIYGTAAKLCKICAHEYENGHKMAAAALAYKCMEVAYLRVLYCNKNRVWCDLQSSLQMVPQGESTSSSVSDVDNLNSLATADKATLFKCSSSHPGIVQLLDFTRDANSAMEAAKKSQDAFDACQQKLEDRDPVVVCVNRVIEFSFQDIEEFVRLVELALNTINHNGLRNHRE